MNNLLRKLRYPERFATHFAIKFLNKKLKDLSVIKPFFEGKKGIEIGGPSKLFTSVGYIPVYSMAETIDGVNFSSETIWEHTIAEGRTYNFGGNTPGYQFIADGTELGAIKAETYDFVLSCHSLEHIANPIKALKEWLRVLKVGGVLMLILPDSRFTFDRRRPVTKFEHLLKDFTENTAEDDLTHIAEILELHDISYDAGVADIESFKKRSSDNFINRGLHHHVFDINLLKEILKYLGMKIVVEDISPPFNLMVTATKEA